MTAPKSLIAAVLVALAVPAYFAENIIGHYRFKKLCESEGGLRIFHPLVKDVGWLAPWQENGLAALYGVAFARFERDGKLIDRVYRGQGLIGLSTSYTDKPADLSTPVVYELRHFDDPVIGHARTNVSGVEVHEISTGRLMIRWTQVGYSKFDQDKTILAAPSGEACFFWGGFYERANAEKYFAPR